MNHPDGGRCYAHDRLENHDFVCSLFSLCVFFQVHKPSWDVQD